LDTTADLVAYCDNVGPVGEVRDGQNFCDGFIAGTGLLYLELVKSKKIKKLACAQPVPTLTEAREAFVSWANANPEHLSDKPIDGFWRAMSASYPCSK
ncbi:MAG: Rap1a/Tai family immunity protein, partial [Geminicoccaceae bacterium]